MRERPNVVLVTVDSLRADHCGYVSGGDASDGNAGAGDASGGAASGWAASRANGHSGASLTPALDALAREGAAFRAAVAPGPSTPESMPAIFTGRYPVDALDPADVADARRRIGRHMATRETLPERLARRGYATAGFTPNPYTSRYFGFDAGFDRFEDFTDAGVRTAGEGLLQRLSPTSDAAQAARMLVNLLQREEVFKPWEAYVEDVAAWIESAERPYFAWIHVMDPHVPYMAPASYRRLSWVQTFRANVAFWRGDKEAGLDPAVLDRLRSAYADAVRYTDAFLNRLESMTDEHTALVVHADHGEAFGEHGSYGHEPYLYEENVHVPLVVGGVPAATVDDPVSLATLPDLLTGLADGDWDPTAATSTFAVSRTAGGDRLALRGRRLKYIRSPTGHELYDLARDEHEPLVATGPGAVCRRRLDRVESDATEARAVRDAVARVPEVRA